MLGFIQVQKIREHLCNLWLIKSPLHFCKGLLKKRRRHEPCDCAARMKKESLSFSRQASLKKGGDILSHIKMQYHLRNRA